MKNASQPRGVLLLRLFFCMYGKPVRCVQMRTCRYFIERVDSYGGPAFFYVCNMSLACIAYLRKAFARDSSLPFCNR